jgi:hypothetical protein
MIAAAGPERRYRALVSTFIVLTLGAQAASLGVTLVSPGWLTAKIYPIIEYPMYAQAHYDGERVEGRWLLRGVLAHGGEIDINEDSLRVSPWDYIHLTDAVALAQPDTAQRAKAIQELVAVVKAREPRAADLSALRLDSYPMKVTRNGAAAMPSDTVVTIPMPAASGSEH